MENKDNNIVVNAKPNTILLQSTNDEVTGGYYDGEGTWHEFGGGGEKQILNPFVTVTWVNDSGDAFQYGPTQMIFTNNILMYLDDPITITEEPITYTLLSGYFSDSDTFGCEVIYISTPSLTANVVESENCTYNMEDGTGFVLVDDPSKDASVSIKVVSAI